jgi:acetyl esterase
VANEADILKRVNEGMKQPAKDIPSLRRFIERNSKALNAVPPEIGAFHENVELRPGEPGPGLTADISVPKGAGGCPVLLYLHGGGWVAGSPKSHQKLGMQFAENGYLTINLDYRLAPEHPFPAGLDDCLFATQWALDNAAKYGGDASRMVIGGDSAGGNLAAATQVELAAAKSPIKFKAGLLIYGLYDVPEVIRREKGYEFGLTMMAKAYLADKYDDAKLNDPRVSPIKAISNEQAAGLAPQYILCGDADFLLPESRAMAEACKRAGVPYELDIVPEMPHGFIQIWMLSAAGAAQRRMYDWMRNRV